MDNFLNPEEFNIDNIFKGKYEIPIYQRPYSWGKNEVKQFLEDISESYGLYKEYNESSHISNEEMLMFAGTLFIKVDKNVKNSYTEYDIVDGQQRITTITLILMVLLNQFYLEQSDDDSVTEIENYLWKKVDRKREKNNRVLTLGNIDKEIMIELFDNLFSKKDIIEYANSKLSFVDEVEHNLLSDLLLINNYLKNNLKNKDEYYEYFDYIKSNIRFIAIEVHTNLVKLFSIFESINSKGKPLEEIDLFKSYIFQNMDKLDYDEYLKKWGQLIIETKDNLMDYFTIYVRANISYYRNSIKLNNFKSLVDNGFSEYFGSQNIQQTMTRLIDDMVDNVKYYKMLTDISLLEKSGVTRKTVAFMMMNNIGEYTYNKALYFKLLSMREKNKLSDKIVERLVEYAFKFILTFQSVCSRESKTTLTVFVDVQNEIYKETAHYDDKIDLSSKQFDKIIYIFNKYITINSITEETLRKGIKTSVTYNRNRKVVKVMLSYLEYLSSNGDVDYLKLNWLLKAGKDIHIDHILPQSPKEDDSNYKYFVSGNSVILKEGQDFIPNAHTNTVGKEDFYNDFLDVIGNLRLAWSNDNIKKSNHLVVLKEFDNTFNTSSQVSTRTISLIKQIISSGLLLNTNNANYIDNSNSDEETVLINEYTASLKYANYRPVHFEFLGEKYALDKYSYAQLLSSFLVVLYDLETDKFKQLANSHYSPMNSDRIYISNNKNNIRKAETIGENIFVETNLSSEYIIKFIYALIKELGFNNTDLKVCLHTK